MDKLLLSQRSQVFDACDPGQVCDYLNPHLGRHRLKIPRRRRVTASLRHRAFASLALCRLHYGDQVRILSPALEGLYHLQLLLRGRCLWQGRDAGRCYGPGELMLINPDEPVDLVYSDDCEKLIVKLPVPLLSRVCQAQHWRVPADGIRFHRAQALRPSTEVLDLLALICAEAENGLPDNLCEPYLQILVSKLLLQLPNNLQAAEPMAVGTGRFHVLVDHIEANLTDELSPRRLADLANLSERGLYALFEREAGCAPMDFVRQRRLERVHRLLGNPGAARRNVTEVALEHGFPHLGRFSLLYKARFGESPSITWRRRLGQTAKNG